VKYELYLDKSSYNEAPINSLVRMPTSSIAPTLLIEDVSDV